MMRVIKTTAQLLPRGKHTFLCWLQFIKNVGHHEISTSMKYAIYNGRQVHNTDENVTAV